MGTDGVIIQDLAVWRLAREHFPGIPVHASTQMTVHNSAGVLQLEDMGFSRVVLARELHIDEIASIVRSTNTEIECFVHGALCFSISGQCFFSSFLGGHSGNRGRCAQPCRRHYRYKGKEGYYFSTNDFSSIDMIPLLADAGVASLKIEGRMKSAEYVATVVEAYRKVLDAAPTEREKAVAEGRELLKLSFGRVPTKGFLASHEPPDIATPHLRGSTGRFLGDVKSVKGGVVTFETRDRLHVGDRVRVQPKSDLPGKAFTVKELLQGGRPVKAVKEKSLVGVPSPFPVKPGDAVFKVSSETAFTMSEAACLRKLESAPKSKLSCSLSLSFSDGSLKISGRTGGIEAERSFFLGELEPGRTEDMQGVLQGQFSRTGETPFRLDGLSAPNFPCVAIPPAKLKEIRREWYAFLAERVLPHMEGRRREAKRRALASLAGKRESSSSGEELAVKADSPRDLNLIHHESVDALVLPIGKAALHRLPEIARRAGKRAGRIVWELPFIIFEKDMPFFREAIEALVAAGFRRFELANISHFKLLAGKDVELSTSYRLFSLNSEALRAWGELGAAASTLYLEDDADNIAELLAADVSPRRRVLAYSPVPAITSKIKIKGVKNDAPVLSDRGDAYTVSEKGTLTIITPARPFSLLEHKERLRRIGCSSFVVDLSETAQNDQGKVLAAFARGIGIEGTSEFNFIMGLV